MQTQIKKIKIHTIQENTQLDHHSLSFKNEAIYFNLFLIIYLLSLFYFFFIKNDKLT